MGDAAFLTQCRAHPDHVVIAPFDVGGGIVHEHVDDLVRSRSAIVDVSDEMCPAQVIAPWAEQVGEGVEFPMDVG